MATSTASAATAPNELPTDAPFPILRSIAEVRAWRDERTRKGETVGFVPTMGALHMGHLSLVRASLASCSTTIVSIFVNPAQFAPTEDLSTYPRTLESDVAALASLTSSASSGVDALFFPPVEALYPGGISTEVKEQVGAFVEVKGLQDVMEGASRPGFFRGVATVVTKLFNIVQPTQAFFGQKDIQQALLLRRMLRDLHFSHPSPSNLIIISTYRDLSSGLALSSRNAYIKKEEMGFATVLIDALKKGRAKWEQTSSSSAGTPTDEPSSSSADRALSPTPVDSDLVDTAAVLLACTSHVNAVALQAAKSSISVQLLYITLNSPSTLEPLQGKVERKKGAILSGAVMLGKTRLIDNLVFGWGLNVA